jgi:hypothetical protein
VLTAVRSLGEVWATVGTVAETAGLTPHETGRLLRSEGHDRTRFRKGNREFWLGTGEPPTPRRVCALAGCEIVFAPNSGSQKFCSATCRDKTYR